LFEVDKATFRGGFFPSSREEVFKLLDARIISNNPSSVRNGVLHDRKALTISHPKDQGASKARQLEQETNPSSLALADFLPPISSSHRR